MDKEQKERIKKRKTKGKPVEFFCKAKNAVKKSIKSSAETIRRIATATMKKILKKSEVKMEPKKQKTSHGFWISVITISIILFGIEHLWLSKYSISTIFFGAELKWNWGLAAFLAQLFYALISFCTVGPTELGVILFFGNPLREVSSGLVFVPFGICQLKTETRLTIQDELPADPQYIFRKEDVESVPPGFFPPIRIPFGFPRSEEDLRNIIITHFESTGDTKKHKLDIIPPVDDPLNVRVTAEVVPIIRWKISDYVQFLITIGSREEARRQIEDCAIGSLTREFAKITPAVALANLGIYSFNLGEEIKKRIDGWGIELKSAQVKIINFHRELNAAIGGVSKAKLEAKAVVLAAEAIKEKERLFGEGKGAAEKAILGGRTDGFKRMADELKISGAAVLGAETARAITENPGQKTIVAGSAGFSELVAVASAVGEVFRKEEKK